MRDHPVTQWLFDQAMERFRVHGPLDVRGAALWDAASAIAEGRAPTSVERALTPRPIHVHIAATAAGLSGAMRRALGRQQ